MRRLFLYLFFLLIVFQISFAQATNTNLDICKTLSSINVYTIPNLTALQKYIQSFFPKLKANGANDSQNKYYISKYQYAFGLKTTGIINPDTLKFLRNQNNCFDLGNTVSKIEKSIPIILVSQEELTYQILTQYVYNLAKTSSTTEYISTEVTVTVATSTQ